MWRHYDSPSDIYGPYDYAQLHDDAGRLTRVARVIKHRQFEETEQPAPWPASVAEEREYNLSGQLVSARYPVERLYSNVSGAAIEFYRWDAAGRLVAIYRQNVGTQGTVALHRQFVWSGSQLVAMYGYDDESPSFNPPELLARFVYVPGSRVPAYGIYPPNTTLNPDTGSGSVEKTYQFVTDHLGSIRLTVDTDTDLPYRRTDYDAFGGVLRDTRPEFHPFGFAGGIDLRGPQLVRFGARDYDPVTGRWVQRDPILFNGGSDNLYVYCNNDPVNCVDPSGLLSLELDVAKGILFVDPETEGIDRKCSPRPVLRFRRNVILAV